MHKKTEANLMALARTILALKKDTDVGKLKEKAQQIYEKLCVLDYLQSEKDHPEEIPIDTEKTVEVVEKEKTVFSIEDEMGVTPDLEDIFIKKGDEVVTEKKSVSETTEAFTTLKDKIEEAKKEEEQESVDDIDIVEKISPQETLNEQSKPKASLNDTLLKKGIAVDLNDRIAFVKHLFEGSQDDFNRVLSQLNTFDTEQAAKDFIVNQVKPDYSWEEKEVHEERFLLLIERKFTV